MFPAMGSSESAAPAPAHDPHAAPRWRRWALVIVIVLAVLSAYIFLPIRDWLDAASKELRDLGALGVVLYIAIYVVATLCAFPAALLSIGAGFAWGPIGGVAVAIPSATLAGATAFTLSRTIFRARFHRWMSGHPRFAAVEHAVESKGAWLVLWLRFSPVFPFPILNYLFGLTEVAFAKFVLATALGMMPITFMYTYAGSLGRELGQADLSGGALGPEKFVVLGVGIAVTIAVTIWVGGTARRALREGDHAAASAAQARHGGRAP